MAPNPFGSAVAATGSYRLAESSSVAPPVPIVTGEDRLPTVDEMFALTPDELDHAMAEIGADMANLIAKHPELSHFNAIEGEDFMGID
ncbi:MAG: hypothetical protein ACLQVD_20435 [Capsulimonadaceae bacterium]